MMHVKVKTCTVGSYLENSYLIDTGEHSILVDPGDNPKLIDETFFSTNCSPLKVILATHGHFDHIGGVSYFKDKFDVPFGISYKDRRILSQANLFRKIVGEEIVLPTPVIDFDLGAVDNYQVGELNFKIHKTPGHSEGSIAIELSNLLFSGDILLENQIGRTDLPGGNIDKLRSSVLYMVNNFIGYHIYPGHGSDFILDENKASYFLSKL